MARPREKTNTAFQQKCLAASEKLVEFQARTLKDDIERLYTDEVLTDVRIDTGCRTICLHRCITKARSEELYNYITALPRHSNNDISMVTNSHSTDIEQCLRTLYTDDEVSAALEKLEKYIHHEADQEIQPEGSEPTEVGTNGLDSSRQQEAMTREDLHVISENITNVSLDLVKTEAVMKDRELNFCGDIKSRRKEESSKTDGAGNDEYSACLLKEVPMNKDSSCGKSQKERCSERGDAVEGMYRLAETIVEQVIREAQIIVGCVQVDTLDKIDRQLEESKDINESVINGVKGEDCDNNTVGDNTVNSSPINPKKFSSAHCATEKQLDSKKSGRFKRLRQSSETVQRILERVYGVKTLMKPCSQLGEDLLRILLEQDSSDCVFEVQGDKYPAHRCVLAARSPYFLAMFGGSWRESGDENIVLEGIDALVLKQTLLYLYGGVIDVDPSCALGGLIMMADMYGMEGLKEVVAYNLNVQYCHFFHRPCPECIAGVPEALALTMMYNMDAMKEKCVRWINKHFGKVWPSKSLATLPQEVLEFCVSSAVKDLALNNVLDIMIDCQRLNEKTPRLRWTEPVFDMITQLMDAAIEFASQNFISLISGNTFRKIDKEGIAFNKQPLEDIFSMIIQALSPENACLAYLSLNKWIKTIEAQLEEKVPLFSEEFVDFVNILYKKCREHLCLYIHQAANTVEWDLLTKDMQEKIMQEANYVCIDTNRGRMARPKLTSMQKKISATSPLSLKEYFDCHFGQSKSPTRISKSRKDQMHETKKGKTPVYSRESSNLQRGKPVSKSAIPKNTVTLNMKTVKHVPKISEKSLKFPAKGNEGSKGKSKPVVGELSQDKMSIKGVIEGVAKVDKGLSSTVNSDGQLPSSLDVDNQSDNWSCFSDFSKTVAHLAADIELVELAKGLQFHQKKPMRVFNVEFFVPE